MTDAGTAADAGADFGYDPGADASGYASGDANDSNFDPSQSDYSTGGGFTDSTGGFGSQALTRFASQQTLLGKPGGYALYQNSDTLPNLGTTPALRPGLYNSGGRMDATSAIVRQIGTNIGRHLSRKAIVRFLIKYGWQVAAAAFNVDTQSLMALFVSEKARPHRRRGPHLYTVLKRIRTGHRYEKMLRRYASRAHLGRHSHSAPRAAPRRRFRVLKGGRR